MKFDVDDKNRCRLVCVKFHLNRCRFAAAVAKCLGGSLLWGHSVLYIVHVTMSYRFLNILIIHYLTKQNTTCLKVIKEITLLCKLKKERNGEWKHGKVGRENRG